MAQVTPKQSQNKMNRLGKMLKLARMFLERWGGFCFRKSPACVDAAMADVSKPRTLSQGSLWMVLLLTWGCFYGVTPNFASEPEIEDSIAAFKKYLSHPPCIERLIYTDENGCDGNTNVVGLMHVLSCCGEGFYIRNITRDENIDLPISLTNKMRGYFFAGRSDGSNPTNWQVNNLGVHKSINPKKDAPDAIVVNSGQQSRIISGIVNLGPQHLTPGSYVWHGDDFEAARLGKNSGTSTPTRKGRIKCLEGRVVALSIEGGWHFLYEYKKNSKRPHWFPSKITVFQNGMCVKMLTIHEVRLGNREDISTRFVPESHVLPQLHLTTLISNGQVIAKTGDKSVLNEIVKPSSTQRVNSGRKTSLLLIFIITLSAPVLLLAAKFIFTKR